MSILDENWERPPISRPPFDLRDSALIYGEIHKIGAKRILEFGPGLSTDAILGMGGVEHITTLEPIEKWFLEAREKHKDNPRVRVLKFEDEMPITLELNEYFDLAFVDAPKGIAGPRKKHPKYEDCSRFNTCKYALDRCPVVLLHDTHRPLEKGTLGRLNELGYKFEILSGAVPGMVKITHGENTRRLDLPRPPKPRSSAPRPDPSRGGIPKRVRRSRCSSGGAKE